MAYLWFIVHEHPLKKVNGIFFSLISIFINKLFDILSNWDFVWQIYFVSLVNRALFLDQYLFCNKFVLYLIIDSIDFKLFEKEHIFSWFIFVQNNHVILQVHIDLLFFKLNQLKLWNYQSFLFWSFQCIDKKLHVNTFKIIEIGIIELNSFLSVFLNWLSYIF